MIRQLVTIGFLFSASIAHAQREPDYYLSPTPPSNEVLDRLNLKLQWSSFIPLVDKLDRIAVVQHEGDQLYVQVTSGKLFVLDANRGEIIWKYTYAIPNKTIYRVALTDKYVFVVNGLQLVTLDRLTGKELFDQKLPSTPSAGPVADEDHVYVVMANQNLVVYSHYNLILPSIQPPQKIYEGCKDGVASINTPLPSEPLSTVNNRSPSVAMLNSLKPPYERPGCDAIVSVAVLTALVGQKYEAARSPSLGIDFRLAELGELSEKYNFKLSPRPIYTLNMSHPIYKRPLIGKDTLLIASEDRTVFAVSKYTNRFLSEFLPDAEIIAPMSQDGQLAYIPTSDSSLYSYSMETNRVQWRYSGSGVGNRKPFITSDSVYVGGESQGLTRIHRENGEKVWRHTVADKILAMNPKYIYATDPKGYMHILDRRRGISLAKMDVRSFNLNAENELTDRIFLGGRNGLLLCLHDRAYRTPVITFAPPKLEPPKKEEPKKEEPRVVEPPKAQPKKEVPKKVEPPKKEEPKKEEGKKEETKKDL